MTVVGGTAVTAYDPDAYTSLDIDLVGAGLTARLDGVLRGQLGLANEGRHWFDEELGLWWGGQARRSNRPEPKP